MSREHGIVYIGGTFPYAADLVEAPHTDGLIGGGRHYFRANVDFGNLSGIGR